MKALRLCAPYDLKIVDEPIPRIGPRDVLVRVKSVGLCASDLHWYKYGRIGTTVMTTPLILGHEASGIVEAIGSEVTNVKPGNRVAIEPARPCGECDYCRAGEINVCPDVMFFGTPPTDGALREYVPWPSDLVMPIPETLSFEQAAMVEPLAIGLYAVQLARLQGSEQIAILGAGAIGLSALQAAKLAGVGEVYVSEPVPERREAAVRLGATGTSTPDHAEEVIGTLKQYGPDIVFECAGENDAVGQAVELARPLGKVIVVGIPEEDSYIFPASTSRRKQLTAIFVRRSKHTTTMAIEQVAAGRLDASLYATHRFPLERAREAFELAISKNDGVIRAVIDLTTG